MKRAMIMFAVILTLLTIEGCSGQDKDIVARNAKWGMSKEEIKASEEKLKDSDTGSQPVNETFYEYNKAEYEGITVKKLAYEFGENDELETIFFQFNTDEDIVDELFKILSNKYGKETYNGVEEGAQLYEWDMEDMNIKLVYTVEGDSLLLVYSNE